MRASRIAAPAHLLIPALAAFSLAGCLVYESARVSIRFDGRFRGSFVMSFGPIGSDEERPEEREEELAQLIFGMVENEDLWRPLLKGVEAELSVNERGLIAEVRGRFDSREALEGFFEIEVRDARFVHVFPHDERLVESNGTAGKNEEGRVELSWPLETAELAYTIRMADWVTSEGWHPRYSLVAEYTDYLRNPGRYEQLYRQSEGGQRGR